MQRCFDFCIIAVLILTYSKLLKKAEALMTHLHRRLQPVEFLYMLETDSIAAASHPYKTVIGSHQRFQMASR